MVWKDCESTAEITGTRRRRGRTAAVLAVVLAVSIAGIETSAWAVPVDAADDSAAASIIATDRGTGNETAGAIAR